MCSFVNDVIPENRPKAAIGIGLNDIDTASSESVATSSFCLAVMSWSYWTNTPVFNAKLLAANVRDIYTVI